MANFKKGRTTQPELSQYNNRGRRRTPGNNVQGSWPKWKHPCGQDPNPGTQILKIKL